MGESGIKQKKDFIGYEYKDIQVRQSMESIYADGFENFGWSLENITSSIERHAFVKMKFKRNRKLRNKMELTRLQRQFEACVAEIETLERSKNFWPIIIACLIGILGTAFMAGAVFSYLGGLILLCIFLAIPAFGGWIAPYFFFTALRRKKALEIDPLIENKYDEIYNICESANSLLDN